MEYKISGISLLNTRPSRSNTDYRHFAKLWTLYAIKTKPLIFEKQLPITYTNIESGLSIKNCQYYTIIDNDNNISGHFYCTVEQSVGKISDTWILIEKSQNSFTNTFYNFKNLNNNAIVGKLSISNLVLRKSLKITLDFIHQDIYKWQVLKADRGFSAFTSKTWSKFCGRLYNGNEAGTFEWDYQSREIYKYRLESLPVIGKVELSNPKNHFLLFAGMFLMEMELQMKTVD